jgi:hypothetical protein
MTLQEFVAAYCPDGPAQLRRLILERTGVDIPYAYTWKWCDPKKPCAVSVENASILHAATQGKCSLNELLSLKTIRARKAVVRKPKRPSAEAAPRKAKAPRESSRTAAAMRKRIAELEAQLAERDSATV